LVTSRFEHKIFKYNALTGAPLGAYASGLQKPTSMMLGGSVTKNHVYVLSGGSISIFNGTNGAVLKNWKNTMSITTTAMHSDFTMTPDGSSVFVSSHKGIKKLHEDTGETLKRFEDKELKRLLDMLLGLGLGNLGVGNLG